jgi:hypothetical protein
MSASLLVVVGFGLIVMVCLKPRALRVVTNATMQAPSCFCLSVYGGKTSHPLCGRSLTRIWGHLSPAGQPDRHVIMSDTPATKISPIL